MTNFILNEKVQSIIKKYTEMYLEVLYSFIFILLWIYLFRFNVLILFLEYFRFLWIQVISVLLNLVQKLKTKLTIHDP